MRYYYRGNLAVEVEHPDSPSVRKKRRITVKPGIPAKEKLLYLFFICVIVTGVGFIGVRYVQISEYNYQIQSTKRAITSVQEDNAELRLKIEQMNTGDRIRQEAAEMGLVVSPDSVHVVESGKSPQQAKAGKAN
ncbi:cell division protein FtsL [Brevibacillus sp. B_LB10_24]|uniref:cell division protein FtsL n=1 Tax=Brevibacillus sp. B_LB10_24 TaxID=3380645 RepID=UPI0038BC6579